MADALDPNSLRAVLRSDESVRESPFRVLASVSRHVAAEPDLPATLDLVLLALEKRSLFEACAPLLDSLARQVGLFPYAEPNNLSTRDLLAYEYHRPLGMSEDRVFHRVQAEVYRRLLAGESVILSAPTSFGKSLLIDALIASNRYSNIAVIVPTLALIDETRRRLSSNRANYKIVTHASQALAERNIFVLTQERALGFANLPRIDFFVIDEFYKLGTAGDQTRTVALNQVFYRLRKGGGQFYLLGPNIERIAEDVDEAYQCVFVQTAFRTVLSETFRVQVTGDDLEALTALCATLKDPTLIYCRSPARANAIGRALLGAALGDAVPQMAPAAAWIAREFHPDWVMGTALANGIGIHHGKLPRSLAHYVVRSFNEEHLGFLVCTSTLIEGVNTKAKNVIIFDNTIARQKFDYFTFNNIRGRSGRMFEHFVGHVYLFHEPPDQELPFVDFPVLTQSATVPTSLLVQLDDADLSAGSRERMRGLNDQQSLPMAVLRENSTIPPEHQVELAVELGTNPAGYSRALSWTGAPTSEQRRAACRLIWRFFVRSRQRRAGVSSGDQLAFKLEQLRQATSAAALVQTELASAYGRGDVDEAVETVLDFARTWPGFEFPRYLMALSRIQKSVLEREGLPHGDYSFYAAQAECLFRTPVIAALDEYGIPLQVAARLRRILGSDTELDVALDRLRRLDVRRLPLSAFEIDVLQDAKASL